MPPIDLKLILVHLTFKAFQRLAKILFKLFLNTKDCTEPAGVIHGRKVFDFFGTPSCLSFFYIWLTGGRDCFSSKCANEYKVRYTNR